MDYFQERVGECVVQMTSLSKDKDGFFVALKFKTAAIAESVLERYHGKYIFGNRVALSYWRAPRNRHSRRLRPQKRDWSPEKTELCDGHRNNTRYSRGLNSLTEQSKSREILANEDNSSRCDYQDHSFVKIYDEREKLDHETECLLEPWEDDNPGEGYNKDNWDYYDFDYAGGSTDLSERKYEGDEDSWYQHSRSAREECEINDSTTYVNEMDSILYKTPYPEADGDSEFCREPYLDRLREECYDMYPEQTVHRTEDDCARERYSEAEHNSLGSQNNIQGEFLEKFPSYEQTNQWPHWEDLSRGSPPRRTVSDPEAPRDTYDQFLQEKEMTEERYGWNKSTGESSRNTRTSSGERPASGEWVNQSDEGRGYRGVPGKNFGLSDYHSMTDLARNRSLSPRPQSSRTLLDRTCSDNDNNKAGGRRSHSPAANRLTSVFVSHRSSSSELSSDYSRYDSSPHRDIPSYSCNKRRSATTQRASYNHTTSKRHSLAEQRKKDIKRISRRREGSLRHSLMLNQQRRHFSSHLRGNIREKGTRHASLERKKRNSSGDFKNSTKSHRSTESCSPPSVSRRKRNHDDDDDDEKSKKDVATAKKRRQTNHRPVDQSETSSRKSENTRKVAMKTTNKGKRQSCEKQKRDIAKPTDEESEKSNTRRTDRLLSDLAASLAEDNISLKRPDSSLVVSKEGSLNGVVSYKGKGSKGAESPFALSKDDSVNHIKEDTEEACQGNVSVNMDTTTVLGVSSLEGNSVEDVEVSKECHDSVKLPRENLLDEKQGTPSAEGVLVTVNLSSQDCFLTAGDKDGAFVKDQIERFDNADLSAIEASNKRSDMTFVMQLEEANRENENFHVDMEFSSDDTSPNGVPTGEMFRFPNKFNNTGNCVGKDIGLTDNGSGLLKTEVSEYVVDTVCNESDNRKGITGRKTEGKCVFTVANDEIENRTCTEADGRKNLDSVELSTNDIRRESYERNASHAMDNVERCGADSQNPGPTEHRSENDKKHVRDTVKDAHRVGTNNTDVFSTCSGRMVDHSLLANDLEHMDMEISDEEQLEDTGNSTACFSAEDKGKFHDPSTPYSAHSSSTWKSNGCHVLTPPKDESSPYSPSHPTNASEGDLEHSNPVKQLCYDEESTGRGDISETRKDDNCATSKVRNDSKTITTVSQQVILGEDSVSTTISNKISRLSVLEYPHLRPLSLTKEAHHQAITYGKCVEGHVGITGACVDAVPTNNDVRDTSNPRKTEGSPSRAREASLNEPSITYSTNSKTVSQSSCLGEPVGKHAKFEERSGCDLMHSERLTVPETKERHVEKTAGHDIRPLLTECFDSHDATLTHTNEAAKGDARDGTCNVNAESEVNSVGRCATAGKRLYAIDPGALDSVDTSTDIDAEVIDSTDYQKGEQHELGGRIAIASVHNNPLVTDCAPSNCRNTRNKDCNLSTKAMNSPSSIRRDENDNCTFLRSSSVASTEANQIPSRDFEKTVGKAINSNTVEKNYRDVSSPSIASIREKENSVLKALWPEGQKESHCSYAAGDAKAVSKHVNCGPDKIEMTSDVEVERPSSSGLSISVYQDIGKQSSLLQNSGKIDIAVNDDKRVENQCHVYKQSIDNTRLGDTNEGVQMQTNLPLPVSGERPRVRVSSIRASRPCKARSKPPKLIIPGKKMAERESHGPGETSKHVSTCAFPSTNVELDHGIKGYSPHETDTVAPEEFKGNKADQADELSSKSSCSNDAKQGQLWQSDVSPTATRNMSVLLTPLETVENTSMENQRGKGVSMDNKWTDKGNKSEWIANKVEQLRKKKEQIEQVYRKDCQTVVSVVKMLVSKDPRLEGVLQNAVRRSLQDMGQRCVQELEREYRPVS